MSIDLKKDLKQVCRHLKSRVVDYPIYENLGPGNDEDPISLITLGFDFDQSCWYSLVFDTRPDASPDGHWNRFIDENFVEMEQWFDRPGKIKPHEGRASTIDEETSEEILAKYIGEMLRAALIQARDTAVLSSLPTTKECMLCVENTDGWYGSIDYLDARENERSEEERQEQLYQEIQKLSREAQTKYWLEELNMLCLGKPTKLAEHFLFPDDVIFEALEQLGDELALPVLKLCYRHSSNSEFEFDRPKRDLVGTPFGRIGWKMIHFATNVGATDQSIKSQLKKILKRACQTNAERKVWGTVPTNAARALHKRFGYPPPKANDRTNALVNLDDYLL